jgi:hypothetical protein
VSLTSSKVMTYAGWPMAYLRVFFIAGIIKSFVVQSMAVSTEKTYLLFSNYELASFVIS